MATLNKTRTRGPVLRTHEGAKAKRLNTEQQLRRSVMACLLWEDTFYEDGASIAERIAEGVKGVSLATAADIAIEAREQQHLRHVPLLIVREMARRGGGKDAYLIGDTLARVIQRPDELTEFLAIYWKDDPDAPLSAQVKKGLATAFGKFDEYQLAKYNRTGKAVTLKDVMFLTHPKPAKGRGAMYKRLANDSLKTPDTWETNLSAGKDKGKVFTRLLKEESLGGLAILRNLRNMQQAGVDSNLIRAGIRNGNFRRVLPFRFISAAKYAPSYEDVLEEAMFNSLQEMPKLPGKTALVLDNSGSMGWSKVSARSDITRQEAAAGVAMLLRELCEEVVIVGFGSIAKVLPNRRGFALAEAYKNGPDGGTNTEKAKVLADKQGYDRIIVVTDEQSHQIIGKPLPGSKGYVINVSTYKNGIGYGPWTHIDGWSESVVRYIQEAEGLTA